jgi:hypothetical protein
MSFYYKIPEFDLGTTPIENIFINDFMPTADGLHVKVYLLAFKLAEDHSGNKRFNNETLAKILSVPLSDVAKAWEYWAGKSIINILNKDSNDPCIFDVEFVSLRQLFIDKNYYTPDRSKDLIVKSVKEERFVKLFDRINSLVANELQPNERYRLMEHLSKEPTEHELVIEAFKNLKVRGAYTNRINLVIKRLFNWKDLNINNVEDLFKHQDQNSQRYYIYRQILKDLGLGYEQPTSGERETIDKWLDQYGFDIDFIRNKILSVTKKVRSPNMNYLDAVFTSEHTGIKPEKKTVAPKTAPKNTRTNKFHNFDSQANDISEEDLEKILLKNR